MNVIKTCLFMHNMSIHALFTRTLVRLFIHIAVIDLCLGSPTITNSPLIM